MLDRTKREPFIQYTIRLPFGLDSRMVMTRRGESVQSYVFRAVERLVAHDEEVMLETAVSEEMKDYTQQAKEKQQ